MGFERYELGVPALRHNGDIRYVHLFGAFRADEYAAVVAYGLGQRTIAQNLDIDLAVNRCERRRRSER